VQFPEFADLQFVNLQFSSLQVLAVLPLLQHPPDPPHPRSELPS
jgi:hypothetical protein